MKNFNKIFNTINNKKTLLCVGPMSKNVVDASIELSDKKNIPIILIASRRQVDSKEFGGGYVNGWNTKDFSRYIKKKGGNLTISNDVTLCLVKTYLKQVNYPINLRIYLCFSIVRVTSFEITKLALYIFVLCYLFVNITS